MKRLAKLTAVVLALTVMAPALPRAAEAEGLTVNVIHKGLTLTISLLALPWHLLHGDTLVVDTCPGGEVPPCEGD